MRVDEVVLGIGDKTYKSARTIWNMTETRVKAYRKIGIGKTDYRRRGRRRRRWRWWLFTYPFMNDITTPPQNKSRVHAWHSIASIWFDRLLVEFGDARVFRPKSKYCCSTVCECVCAYVVWFFSTIYRVVSKYALKSEQKYTDVHREIVCCKKQQQQQQKRIRHNGYVLLLVVHVEQHRTI